MKISLPIKDNSLWRNRRIRDRWSRVPGRTPAQATRKQRASAADYLNWSGVENRRTAKALLDRPKLVSACGWGMVVENGFSRSWPDVFLDSEGATVSVRHALHFPRIAVYLTLRFTLQQHVLVAVITSFQVQV